MLNCILLLDSASRFGLKEGKVKLLVTLRKRFLGVPDSCLLV